MGKPIARIDDWSAVPGPDGPVYLVGRVSGHPNQATFQTDTQITSRLIQFLPNIGLAETENTIYDLGKPAVEYDAPAAPVFCSTDGGSCGCG